MRSTIVGWWQDAPNARACLREGERQWQLIGKCVRGRFRAGGTRPAGYRSGRRWGRVLRNAGLSVRAKRDIRGTAPRWTDRRSVRRFQVLLQVADTDLDGLTIIPVSAWEMPARMRSKVVFPWPLRQIKPMCSRGPTAKDTSRNNTRSPKDLVRPATVNIARFVQNRANHRQPNRSARMRTVHTHAVSGVCISPKPLLHEQPLVEYNTRGSSGEHQ